MVWDEIDLDQFLPEEKEYSIVQLDTMKPPFHEDAAVKDQEVDDLSEAALPDMPETIWIAYDRDGNSQVLESNVSS